MSRRNAWYQTEEIAPLLDAAAKLVIPALECAKKRKRET